MKQLYLSVYSYITKKESIFEATNSEDGFTKILDLFGTICTIDPLCLEGWCEDETGRETAKYRMFIKEA